MNWRRIIPMVGWPYGNGYNAGGWEPEANNRALKVDEALYQVCFVVLLLATIWIRHQFTIPVGILVVIVGVVWLTMTIFYADFPYIHMAMGLGIFWGIVSMFLSYVTGNEAASVLCALLFPEFCWIVGYFKRALEPKHQ